MAQSVKRLTSAQVMISQFVSLSPTSSSVLTAQSLEPASDSVSLCLCLSPAHALSLSVSKKKKKKLKKQQQDIRVLMYYNDSMVGPHPTERVKIPVVRQLQNRQKCW